MNLWADGLGHSRRVRQSRHDRNSILRSYTSLSSSGGTRVWYIIMGLSERGSFSLILPRNLQALFLVSTRI